jgi:AraC-like DNA-binding protein
MHFFYSKTDLDASTSTILDDFDFINDFGFEEYKDIRQKPLRLHFNQGIEICYVSKGRYEWAVGEKRYLLFPGDGFITCPWQKHGSPREAVDLGEIYWLVIKPQFFIRKGLFSLGNWSRLSIEQCGLVSGILSNNEDHRIRNALPFRFLFEELQKEILHKDFGYFQRVCNIVEEFLITSVRLIQNREKELINNQQWFHDFDSMLKVDLSKKWTLREMANQKRIGITKLTQLIKEHTGYTPANYLTFLRLEKAKHLLVSTGDRITNIALDCGFYSSQHFSSTFLKWMGKTPAAYRKLYSV